MQKTYNRILLVICGNALHKKGENMTITKYLSQAGVGNRIAEQFTLLQQELMESEIKTEKEERK